MANQLPAKMKTADVQRFIQRANQVEKYKLPIAYWCRYQALNNILSKGLQSTDEQCMQYAAKLMDNVEEMKSQHASDAAIMDESIASAYIQHFGLEVFERADKQMRNNTVNAQTADTLQAAVTFLDLLQIWQPVPADIIAKVRYAKFHALRIVRAIKAGEDPNATNPIPEPEPVADDTQLDPNDPEVLRIQNAAAYQPSVEDAHDETGLPSPPSVPSSYPQHTSSAPRPVSTGAVSPVSHQQPAQHLPVSPDRQLSAGPSPVESNPRKDSLGGGYFPETMQPQPHPPSFLPPPPSAPPAHMASAPPAAPPSEAASRAFYQSHTPSAPAMPPIMPPQQRAQPPPQPSHSYTLPPHGPPVPDPHQNYIDDDVAMAQAQKHARWAISALNFEDVPTAVSELQSALRTLGAG